MSWARWPAAITSRASVVDETGYEGVDVEVVDEAVAVDIGERPIAVWIVHDVPGSLNKRHNERIDVKVVDGTVAVQVALTVDGERDGVAEHRSPGPRDAHVVTARVQESRARNAHGVRRRAGDRAAANTRSIDQINAVASP